MRYTSKKQKFLLSFTLVFILTCMLCSATFAKAYVFKWSNIKEIEVTSFSLNVRTGPGTSYNVIGTLKQGTIVSVVGTLGSWYVIHMDNDMIGVISSTYTRVVSYHNPTTTETPKDTTGGTTTTPTTDKFSYPVTDEEQKMIDLINSERAKNGLTALKADLNLMRVARIKADDLSKNQYFSHQSPTYGSPFDMMKSFGISYQTAGENIAGNNSVEAAHTALMNSSGHRANILSSSFDTVGIGIVSDPRYGKVFVQMFIKK